jgi:FkbM family methyltransferase
MSTTPAQPADRSSSRLLPRPLRTLLRHPRIEPRIAAVLRSTAVRGSLAFALRELAGRPSRHVYTIRESGLRALIEHGGADAHALDQAFYQHAHEPPAKVVALLLDLDRPVCALDLGANVGMWGLWLHGRFAVERIVALEPDPENVSRHRRQIELNDLGESWEVVQAAAVTADGPVLFTVGRATNGRVADATHEGVESVPGRDTFALLNGLDLLKIDIEGGEWAILADPRAVDLQVPVAMLEYHAHNAPLQDPQAQARRALERAGYATETRPETDPGFGVVWGWKPACASDSI